MEGGVVLYAAESGNEIMIEHLDGSFGWIIWQNCVNACGEARVGIIYPSCRVVVAVIRNPCCRASGNAISGRIIRGGRAWIERHVESRGNYGSSRDHLK